MNKKKIIQISSAMTSFPTQTLGGSTIQVLIRLYGLDEDGVLWLLKDDSWEKVTDSPLLTNSIKE